MPKIERLSREDFKKFLESPLMVKAEILKIFEEELDLVIDPDLGKEEMLDEIFSAYNNAIVEVEENRRREHIENKFLNKKTKKRRKKRKGTVKDFILDKVKEGKFTKKDILEAVDEAFNYRAQGKNPKVRVSKVVRDLKKTDDLEEAVDGTLSIKGYKSKEDD